MRLEVISTIESRKRVRSRVRGASELPDRAGKLFVTGYDEGAKEISATELVTHSVYGAEGYRTGGGAFQFLAKLQDVVVHSAG